MLTGFREWLANILSQIVMVCISLCGMLSPEIAVNTVEYVMEEINKGREKEKKIQEIAMQQAIYLQAVEKGRKNGC